MTASTRREPERGEVWSDRVYGGFVNIIAVAPGGVYIKQVDYGLLTLVPNAEFFSHYDPPKASGA
jgi:hypothetical protein